MDLRLNSSEQLTFPLPVGRTRLLFNNPADRAKVRKKRASEITQDLQLEPEPRTEGAMDAARLGGGLPTA